MTGEFRKKTNTCCEPPFETNQTMISKGVYEWIKEGGEVGMLHMYYY